MAKMGELHIAVGAKLVEIEDLLKEMDVPMASITLFARQPSNDNMSLL